MHILLLPSWYPTETDDVGGSFFREQGQALARYGHRVSVFARHKADIRGYEVKKAGEGSFTEYHIHYHLLRLPVTFLYVVWIMVRLMRTELRRDRPDIIHVHSVAAVKYARVLRLLFGIPYVVTEHSSRVKRKMGPREIRRLRRFYDSAEAVIAVSEGLKEHMHALTTRKILVIPNMVDPRFLDAPLRSPAADRFRYVFVGGLNAAKGLDNLLTAFAEIHGRDRDTELVLCGDGEERENLLRRIGELSLSDSVLLRGQVSRERCAQEILDGHALVLPSRTETFGVVCAEALACGRPIVMTKTDAWRSLVTPETGLAVEIGDVRGLANAMESLRRQYDFYHPETIRAYCRERFSPETVCRRVTRVYEDVLGR